MIKKFKKAAYKIAEWQYNRIERIGKDSLMRIFFFAFDYFPKFVGYGYKLFLPLGLLAVLFFNFILFKNFPCVVVEGEQTCSLTMFIILFLVINLFFIGFIFVSLIFYYMGDFLVKKSKGNRK